MKKRRGILIISILALLSLVVVIIVVPDKDNSLNAEAISEVSEDLPEPAANYLYGIRVDSAQVVRDKVGRRQSLADVLDPHGITPLQVYRISLLPDSLVNERRIKPGNAITLIHPASGPSCIVYEKDALNYVRIFYSPDSVWAENGVKPVDHRMKFVSGTITSSLWVSMKESDANPMLAVELSEIFAWTIDFFGIQQGDMYKVAYEESYVDSQSVGIRRILGAWIYHNQTEFWAVPFEQNGVRSFFDEEGNSLRKAFLKAPLRFSRISSGFSHSRYHPVLKIRRPHHGVDYAAPSGTPVLTVGDGVITKVGYQRNGGGNYVKIKHNSVYSTTYMHLKGFGKGVKAGRRVKQGDVIGYVGATGLATGPHLDFRFYKNGSAVNPLRVEAPPVEPVHEENLSAYHIRLALTRGMLKLI